MHRPDTPKTGRTSRVEHKRCFPQCRSAACATARHDCNRDRTNRGPVPCRFLRLPRECEFAKPADFSQKRREPGPALGENAVSSGFENCSAAALEVRNLSQRPEFPSRRACCVTGSPPLSISRIAAGTRPRSGSRADARLRTPFRRALMGRTLCPCSQIAGGVLD